MMKNPKETKKVLVVDDDSIHLEIVRAMLEEEYTVITVNSGKAALQYLLDGILPDIIFLDILMPDMNGWETFHRLKAISFLHNVPIAFFTALSGKDEEEKARNLGASDFIRKPCEREELIRKIELLTAY